MVPLQNVNAETYFKARRKVRLVVLLYGAIALAPLIATIVSAMVIMGPTAKLTTHVRYLIFATGIWGLMCVQMALSYVRAHPLPCRDQ